jgi:hypothetical protein
MKMNRLKSELLHFKLRWFGDKEMDKHGNAMLPCRRCLKPFLSYCHFHDDYNQYCHDCSFLDKNADEHLQFKKQLEQAICNYNSKIATWADTKAILTSIGIKVRYCPANKRCALNNCELTGNEPTLGWVIKTYPKQLDAYKIAKHWLATSKLKPTSRLCQNCFAIGKPWVEYAKED